MTRNICTGLVVTMAWSLFGCGSDGEVKAGTQPGSNAGGSDASAGTSGTSGTGKGGSSGTGAATNAGGSGRGGAGTSGAGGAGTSGAGGAGTSGAGGAGTSGAGGAGTSGAGGVPTFGNTQCTDGDDNDGDGKIDSQDPECTGPLDNDEGSYATGIPGDNVDQCQDCFFDGDSGQGNDGCAYPSSCLMGVDPGGVADCFNCDVSTRCVDYCKPNTPNGCDCFGCCAVTLPGGGTKTVSLSSTCSVATINDPTKCQTCTQSTTCVNRCETCELCLGKTTLPASCTPTGAGGTPGTGGAPGGGGTLGGGGTPTGGVPSTGGTPSCPTPSCSPGQAACGVSCLPDCPTGEYCLTGCCVRPPA